MDDIILYSVIITCIMLGFFLVLDSSKSFKYRISIPPEKEYLLLKNKELESKVLQLEEENSVLKSKTEYR